MSEFSAPSGPPPPKVPEGWKAQWNEQYSEWFYVNIYTKKSQWDKPMEPAHPPGGSGDAPPGAPPRYDHKSSQDVGPEKSGNAYASNNPYSSGHGGPGPDISEDEKLARQLQAEENSHSGNGSRGANESYYGGGSQPYSSQQQELPPRPQDQGSGGSRGFLGKLLGKNKVNQPPQSQPYGQQYGQQQYSQPPYNQQQYSQPPQGYGGGYPQQGYGPPAGGYGGGYPPPGGYGGYPPQQQAGRRTGGGGLGAAGGAALGGVAGLAGGMMLMDAIDDHDQEAYQEGYNDGQDNDYGGGDDGGDF